MRKIPKNVKIITILVLLILIGYIIYLIPRWITLTLVGLGLVRVGWYLYDS